MQILGLSVQEVPRSAFGLIVSDCICFSKQSCQMLLNQLREITGIQDPSFLHEALKVGFQSRFTQQSLKQFSTSQGVSSSYFYTRPKYRNRNPTGQMVSFLNRETLKKIGNLQLGKPVGIPSSMCFVWTLCGSWVQPTNQKIFQQRSWLFFRCDVVILNHCW